MASNFIEGTSPLSGPAFIHLDTSLLMVMHIATSGCLNLFACFSWPAPLSASVVFSRGLLFSAFNSLYHVADASNLPCHHQPLGFPAFPLRNGSGGAEISVMTGPVPKLLSPLYHSGLSLPL